MSIVHRKISMFYVSCVCFFVVMVSLSACSATDSQTAQVTLSGASPSASSTKVLSTPTVQKTLRSDFERGMIYPRWHPTSYGATDTDWQQGIQTIKAETSATWMEIPALFDQSSPYSTDVSIGGSTPGLDAFVNGVREAHSLGYHVFFVPLLAVNTPDGWSGIVQPGSFSAQQVWFQNYWNTLKPYAEAAQNNGVEQMAIGTELQWLEQNVPASLWEELISNVHSVFHGTLTYDMNWPSLYVKPASWMKDPDLSQIGVSEYISLVDTSQQVDPNVMPGLWKSKVGDLMDAFSAKIGKSMIITEIGYRDTFDAVYDPWNQNSSAPSDTSAQAAAFYATLVNAFADSHITGIFFWGWDGVGRLGIKGQQAVRVINSWYSKK